MGGTANASLQSQYDAVKLTARHSLCADCPFQFLAFGGVEYARVGETLTGTFTASAGTYYHQYVSSSLFDGAGPRLGIESQYNFGCFQFFGEAAGSGLIGSSQTDINFATAGPTLVAINNQSLTSPNVSHVVSAFDAKVGTSYTFPASADNFFKLEVGYQVAAYFNVLRYYELSMVTGSLLSRGVHLDSDYQEKSNLTVQGPYLKGSVLF